MLWLCSSSTSDRLPRSVPCFQHVFVRVQLATSFNSPPQLCWLDLPRCKSLFFFAKGSAVAPWALRRTARPTLLDWGWQRMAGWLSGGFRPAVSESRRQDGTKPIRRRLIGKQADRSHAFAAWWCSAIVDGASHWSSHALAICSNVNSQLKFQSLFLDGWNPTPALF